MISEEKIRVYNKTLEPNLWDEDKNLKSLVRLALLKIAKNFYESTDFKSELVDILLLGSSVNYTWTPESDIDVHLVMDITKENLDTEHYRKFLDALAGDWNQKHKITIAGHKVEVYLQDITEKNSTPEKARKHGAMYSLLHNKWLVPPKYEPRTLDKEAIRKAFHSIKDKIEKVLSVGDVEGLKELMKSIRDYRNKGMESDEGEFSIENIVFKALRHTGLLEKLKDGINKMYDRLVSIEEMQSYLNKLNDLDEDLAEELISETIDELEEKDKPYILVGAVDGIGEIEVLKSQKIDKPLSSEQPFKSHGMLTYDKLDFNTVVNWRYRSDINELMFWDYPSEIQSLSVKEYLRKNYKLLESPKVVLARELTRSHRKSFHDLDYKYGVEESVQIPVKSDDFIVTGMISYDLDVVGDSYVKGGTPITHGNLKSWYGNWNNSIDWRYRNLEHKVYYKEHEPNEQQKQVIIDFLHDEYNVKQTPRFVPMTPENKASSHGYLQEVFDRVANFYLGWIKRDNHKIIATDIHPETDEHETHFNYRLGIPELRSEPDRNLVRWRFRRDKNSIYWWSNELPNEDEKQAVEDWVVSNLNVQNPQHRIMSAENPDKDRNRFDAHNWDY